MGERSPIAGPLTKAFHPLLELSLELRNNSCSCVTRKAGAMTSYFFCIEHPPLPEAARVTRAIACGTTQGDPYLARRVD